MFQKIITLSLLFLLTNPLFSQQELSLHFADNLLQASKTNPAFTIENRFAIGLPSAMLNYHHTGASFNDLLQKNSNGENILSIDAILDQLESDNILRSNLEVESFNIALNLLDFQIGLSHNVKINGFVNYPKNLPEFLWNGNAQFIGSTVEIGPDVQIYAYNEFGFTLAKSFKRLNVGARFKFLTGIGDVSTDQRQASVFTSDDVYQISLNTDYKINTSSYLRIDSLTSFAVDTDISNYSMNDLFTSNKGYAFDFGISYELTDRLTLAASVVDLGRINWNTEVRNYVSQGTVNYNGLDISNVIRDENLNFGNLTDTLDQIFKFEETANNYSTQLPRKIYLSAKYKWNDLWTFNGLYLNENYRGESFSSFALGANANIWNFLSLGASYAVRNGKFDNLGLNASAKLGPVQLYFITDNVIAAVQPFNTSNMNMRFGLNLVFGKLPVKEDIPPVEN